MPQRRSPQGDQTAIIGAGLGGLVCATLLAQAGYGVTCFDKAARPGGRAATRISQGKFQFDHGAQYFTCRDAHFQEWVERWLAEGIVAEWPGRIAALDGPGEWKTVEPLTRYVGVPKMSRLGEALAHDLDIRFETQVSRITSVEGGYQLFCQDQELGRFDRVLWNCPPLQVQKLVPADCAWQPRLDEVVMLPCWAVMLALDAVWDLPSDGIFANGSKLSWLARDSSKPGRDPAGYLAAEGPFAKETWVLHSSTDWATANLETSPESVIATLVLEAERITQHPMPRRVQAIAHRWLYSRPLQSLPEACLWDRTTQLGACGDWSGQARVEGAILSGLSLAKQVMADA